MIQWFLRLFVLDRVIMRWLFRLRAEGLERLPEEYLFVLTPKPHQLPRPVRGSRGARLPPTAPDGTGRLDGRGLRQPAYRTVSRLAQAVPIDPDRAGVSSLAFGTAELKREKNLLWFPEGERSPTGKLRPFKPGIGVSRNHFRVPVMPGSITIPALCVYSGSPYPDLRVQVAHTPASGQPRDLLQRPWLLEEVRSPRYNLQPLLRTHLLQRIPVHIDHGKVIAPDNKERRRRDAR
jgi:hypothetical protein